MRFVVGLVFVFVCVSICYEGRERERERDKTDSYTIPRDLFSSFLSFSPLSLTIHLFSSSTSSSFACDFCLTMQPIRQSDQEVAEKASE